MSTTPADLSGIKNITVSGRIASGSTSLANGLSHALNWRHIEGGEVFWEAIRAKIGADSKDTHLRADKEDQDFDESLKTILKESSHIVLETKLAGFNASGIEGIFKILVVCEDEHGEDQTQIRIDRLVNREGQSIEASKEEVLIREKSDLEKWRKLYVNGDQNWVYWDKKYYDLVINTYLHYQNESLQIALKALKYDTP